MTTHRLLRRATCLVVLPCFLMVATGCAKSFVVRKNHVAKARAFEKQGIKNIKIPAKSFYYARASPTSPIDYQGQQKSEDYTLRWKKITQIRPRDARSVHVDIVDPTPGIIGAGVVSGGLGLGWMLTSPLFFCDENYQNCTNETMMWSVTGGLMGLGLALLITGLAMDGPVSRSGPPNPLRW